MRSDQVKRKIYFKHLLYEKDTFTIEFVLFYIVKRIKTGCSYLWYQWCKKISPKRRL